LRLKRRSEFLAVAATGRRVVAPAFELQAGPRPDRPADQIGLGFTASRKVGNAVARNRAKRRLVAATSLLLPGAASPGYNYVVVARTAVLSCPFPELLESLKRAFARAPEVRPSSRPRPGRAKRRPAGHGQVSARPAS
jgi:ribonuclease P protein component